MFNFCVLLLYLLCRYCLLSFIQSVRPRLSVQLRDLIIINVSLKEMRFVCRTENGMHLIPWEVDNREDNSTAS